MPAPGASIPVGGAGATGAVTATLEIAAGVSVTTLDWTVIGPYSYSGTVEIGDARSIEFVAGGIEAAAGYTLSLSGTDSNSDYCTGSSMPFAVIAGASTPVSLVATCTVATDAALSAEVVSGSVAVDAGVSLVKQPPYQCPGIASFSVTPAAVVMGQPVQLAVTTVGPTPAIRWTASGAYLGSDNATEGTFSNVSAANPTFQCGTPGPVNVSVQVGLPNSAVCNGVANTSYSANVNCECPEPGLTACLGLCVDTSSDAAFCGSCDTRCNGVCIAGQCQAPQVLLREGTSISNVVTTGGYVYATDGMQSTVTRMSSGGGAPTVVASNQSGPYVLAANAETVCWVQGVSVNCMPASGGPITTIASSSAPPVALALNASTAVWIVESTLSTPSVVLAEPLAGGGAVQLSSGGSPSAIAVDATSAYFSDADTGMLNAVPIGGGPSRTLAGGSRFINALSVDSSNLYWVESEYDQATGTFQGSVKSVPLSGGPSTTLTSGAGDYAGIALHGGRIYWAADRQVNSILTSGGTVSAVSSATRNAGHVSVDATNVYWVASQGTLFTAPLAGGAATPLISASYHPQAIAIDSTSAYVADVTGNILKAPLAGGPSVLLATVEDSTMNIAVDSSSVYWTAPSLGTVLSVPIGGGTTTTLASGQHYPQGLAVDSSKAYWVLGDGSVASVPLNGGTPTVLAPGRPMAVADPFFGIAVDLNNLYWADGGSVRSLPLAGGTPQVLTAFQPVSAVAVDAANVYWLSSMGTVGSVPIGGGAPTLLVSGQSDVYSPWAIAVDAKNIYFTDTGGFGRGYGAVKTVSIHGGPTRTIALQQETAEGIAIDSTHVYWTDRLGTVLSAVK